MSNVYWISLLNVIFETSSFSVLQSSFRSGFAHDTVGLFAIFNVVSSILKDVMRQLISLIIKPVDGITIDEVGLLKEFKDRVYP